MGVVKVPGRSGSAIFSSGGNSLSTGEGEPIGSSGWILRMRTSSTSWCNVGHCLADARFQAVRERIAIIRFFQPQATKIVGHSDLKPTSCPGNHVRALLLAGAFEPDGTDDPIPPPTLVERVEAIEAEIEKLKAR